MRKGTILLFLGKNEDRAECIEFLKGKLNPIRSNFHSGVETNGCYIHIFKGYSPNYCGGARSEICYINSSIDTEDKADDNHVNWFDVKSKTEMYSNRKQPVRFIRSFKDIDIKELLNDDYALKHTIDKDKMEKWSNNLNNMIDINTKNNKESFKQEYECKWIEDKDSKKRLIDTRNEQVYCTNCRHFDELLKHIEDNNIGKVIPSPCCVCYPYNPEDSQKRLIKKEYEEV